MQSQQLSQEVVQKLIKDSPRRKCSCGCEYWDTATAQVEISALSSGTGKSEILLVGVLICRKCGAENQPRLIETN
jgi:hypothetical protein